jgi:hypothetical protein
MTNITRRQLGLLAVSSIAVAQAPPDWLAQAVQSKREAADDLAKFEIEIAVEPAFQFKA